MGLCRCALEEAVLAVKVEVEASLFHAGVDDMSLVGCLDSSVKNEMIVCIFP